MRKELLVGLFLLSSVQAGEMYPAADFEPKVIYRAEETTAAHPLYPAANVEPQVVYRDPVLIEQVGPQPVSQPEPGPQTAPPLAQEAPPPKPSAPVADVSPPLSVIGFVALVIALAFFWFGRRERAKSEVRESPSNPGPGAAVISHEAVKTEALREDLEELAAEIEQTIAVTNRQRAGKTRRTRRR
ncbi:MAG: hypothetical protein N3A55_06190 [Methylohalobius sp.]|nr:hypothetical protein [Methylohalobius sp.]